MNGCSMPILDAVATTLATSYQVLLRLLVASFSHNKRSISRRMYSPPSHHVQVKKKWWRSLIHTWCHLLLYSFKAGKHWLKWIILIVWKYIKTKDFKSDGNVTVNLYVKKVHMLVDDTVAYLLSPTPALNHDYAVILLYIVSSYTKINPKDHSLYRFDYKCKE